MAQQSGWAGKKYKNRNPGRAYSGREEEGSAAVGDRLEGSTEVGGRMPPGVSPGGGGGGGREVLGVEEGAGGQV